MSSRGKATPGWSSPTAVICSSSWTSGSPAMELWHAAVSMVPVWLVELALEMASVLSTTARKNVNFRYSRLLSLGYKRGAVSAGLAQRHVVQEEPVRVLAVVKGRLVDDPSPPRDTSSALHAARGTSTSPGAWAAGLVWWSYTVDLAQCGPRVCLLASILPACRQRFRCRCKRRIPQANALVGHDDYRGHSRVRLAERCYPIWPASFQDHILTSNATLPAAQNVIPYRLPTFPRIDAWAIGTQQGLASPAAVDGPLSDGPATHQWSSIVPPLSAIQGHNAVPQHRHPTCINRKAISSASCGPIRASTPMVHVCLQTNTKVLGFEYSHDRKRKRYFIDCKAMQAVDTRKLTPQFKETNCVYPSRLRGEDQRIQRLDYETSCNEIAWQIAYVNRDLQGKRGALQRAVDTYRNSLKGKESRRVRREMRERDRASLGLAQQYPTVTPRQLTWSSVGGA
ncbi:hypothetical protein ANO11243_068120 [Dothideomycetidae sp. 11243]|nr:hypothetical protein ANO11243_068120 [fungal sp. No.11243]